MLFLKYATNNQQLTYSQTIILPKYKYIFKKIMFLHLLILSYFSFSSIFVKNTVSPLEIINLTIVDSSGC